MARCFPRIRELRAYVSSVDEKQHVQGADCHDVSDLHWINGNLPCGGELLPIANPMSLHPPYKRYRHLAEGLYKLAFIKKRLDSMAFLNPSKGALDRMG